MATLADALSMQRELSYEALLSEHTQLQNSHSIVMEERETLKKELQIARSELMLAKSIVAKEEDARRKMEQASESKQIENQNLLGRVAAIRKELIASKDRNKILYSNNRKLDSKLSELTSNYEQATIREIQNKGLIKNLEDRIKSLVTQNDNMCKSLRDTQEKNRQLEESHRNHSYQLITEKDAIARENDTLRSRITELLLQVQDNSSRADMATHQFEEARRGRDRLHDQFNKMKALYNSSVETYKRSAACSKEELEQVKATLEETKLSAQDTQRNLEDELDTLKQAYTECESRLHVALNRLRSIAKDPSEFEVSEERADYITTLISQYERSTNKDWEEVYEDFFDLREKHTRTLIENKSLKSMNDDLVKEVHTLRDQDRVVKSHCSELQTENASLRDQASHLKAANHQSKEKIEELQQKMATLTQSNEELDRSLRNTTYQFRYLIRDVQCRNEILPPGIDECNDLASYISITPTEAHEKIVFRDVDELQKRNQELLNIAAELRHNLDNRLNELNQLKQSYHDLQEQHSKEKQSYNDKLNSVTRQIEILETSIQEVTNERDTLKKVVADHVRMTSRAVNLELQRELEVCKEKLVTMENEMKSERTEASEEIGRIQARVAEAEEVVKEARSEYEQTRTRAKQLAEEASRLTIDLQSAKLEIQNLTDHVQTAQTQLLDQAAVIQQLQADLTSEQHARATLHQQKTSIETQLEYQQQLYDTLKSQYSSMKVEEEKLRTLIQEQHDDAWSKRDTIDELVTSMKGQIKRQADEIAKYKQDLEEARKSTQTAKLTEQQHWIERNKQLQHELIEVKNEYENLTKVLDNIKAENAELLKSSTASHPMDIDMSGEADQNEVMTQLVEYKQRYHAVNEEIIQLKQEYDRTTMNLRENLERAHTDIQERDNSLREAQAAIQENDMLKKGLFESEQRWTMKLEAMRSTCEALTQTKEDLTADLQSSREIAEALGAQVHELKGSIEQGQKQHALDREIIASLEQKISERNSELGNIRVAMFNTEGRLRNAELQLIKEKEQWAIIEENLQKNLASTKEQFSKLTQIHEDTLTSLTERQLSGMASDANDIAELANRTIVQLREALSTLTAENDQFYSQWKAALDQSENDKSYVEHINKKMKNMHEEIERLQKENQELEDKYASMLATSAVSDNRVEYEKLQLMCADLENQTKTLNTQLCAKQTELEKCHARINSLEAELKMHGDTVQLLERAKKEWTTRSSGLLSKFIKSDPAETQTVQEENVPVKVSLITAQDEKHTADAKTGESAKEKETLNELNNMKRQLHKYQTFASQLTAKLTATKAELNAKKEEHTSLKETVEGLNEKNRELQQSQANLTKEFDELKGKYTKVLYRIKESIRKEAASSDNGSSSKRSREDDEAEEEHIVKK